jgi:hypothetical protein
VGDFEHQETVPKNPAEFQVNRPDPVSRSSGQRAMRRVWGRCQRASDLLA